MRKLIVMLLLLLSGALTALAQGAPEQINAALADLGTRVGRPVALSELSNWRWEQNLYPDTSLGCPQPEQVYAQVQTIGYKFTLTYAGTIYDYRVSGDSSIVILCGTQDASEPTATPLPEDRYSNPICPEPEAGQPPYMRTRLVTNIQARVLPGGANRLRADAALTAAETALIPGGAVVTVTGGPRCADGVIWWEVNYDGLVGWTAEGQDDSFFLGPAQGLRVPARMVISTENAAGLVEFSRLQGRFGARLSWSPDGQMLALPGIIGADSVWLYDMVTLDEDPRNLDTTGPLLDVAFSPDGRQVLAGGVDGSIRLLNVSPAAPLVETLFLQTHQSTVSAVAFTPDGLSFAAAGSNAVTAAQVDRSYAVLLWDIATVVQTAVFAGHTDTVLALAFSPDGSRLVSISQDGSLRIWDVEGRAGLHTLNLPAAPRSVAYSHNGQFLAVGTAEGGVLLLDAATNETVTSYTGHAGAVNAVAFSPDDTILASAGEEGTVRLWSTQSDLLLATLTTAPDVVGDMAFSPDGELLATAARNNTLRLWGVRLLSAGG